MAKEPTKPQGKSEGQAPSNGRTPAMRMQLVPMQSDQLSRAQFANQAGLTYQDPTTSMFRRDVYAALGYPKTITPKQYWDRYQRGGIAERIVEAYPNATWGSGGRIVEDPNPKVQTTFETAVEDLFERLDIWNRFRQSDILAGLGHYSVILLGADGELSTPLPDNMGEDGLLYMTPRSEVKAQVASFDEDPGSKRFGLVERYTLTLAKQSANNVHWSRVRHIVEGNLENEVFGKPRLKGVWNYLEDLDKNVGGGSEAAWKRMDPGMHIDIPFVGPNGVPLEIDEQVEQDVEDEVEEFQHGMRRVIRTRGVDLEQFKADATMFGGNVDTILKLVSATTGIPFRILTGSERGQLASTQDQNNWNDRIAERRSGFAEELIRGFVNEMVNRQALPQPGEDGYQIVWPDADEMSEGEKAENAKNLATANRDQANAGDGIIVTRDEIRETVFGLDPLDAADLELADGEDNSGATETDEEDMVAAADFVDEDAPEPEWKAVHRAADAHVEPFTEAVLDLWTLAGEGIPQDEFTQALEDRDAVAAADLVQASFADLMTLFAGSLSTALFDTLVDGADNTAAVANKRDSWTAAQVEIAFDQTNQRAISWAEARAATLVTETGPETIAGIRQLIVSGFTDGIPPTVLSRQIRSHIGLRQAQATAVQNLRNELLDADPGDLVTRFPPSPGVRTKPGFRVRIPEGGLPAKDLTRRVEQYASMQLNLRARTIARTETMRASNEGQKQLWLQAQGDGQLSATATREWIVTPDDRLRDEHADRAGVTVGVNESWPWGTEPGEEVNCRCAQGIAKA